MVLALLLLGSLSVTFFLSIGYNPHLSKAGGSSSAGITLSSSSLSILGNTFLQSRLAFRSSLEYLISCFFQLDFSGPKYLANI